MSRTKGTEKTGGREKGTPNKVTTDLRTWINELLDINRRQIAKDIKRLEPQQRVMIFEKLLSYAVPKMQSVEAKIDINRLTDEQLDTIIVELSKQIEK
ncbi:hypothetical protein FACS1894182_03420 [Bacteroidia bacterium]|nr:hypothetical protein FACS1894182_03420 [Bacteroidia bacterium]